MGILDGLLGQVTGSVDGPARQQTGLTGSLLNMLMSGEKGGLPGLIQRMRDKGMGGVADTWVRSGPNQSVTPEQAETIIGNDKVQQLAREHGQSPDEIKKHLAQLLPVAVDKLTPNGTLPAVPSSQQHS